LVRFSAIVGRKLESIVINSFFTTFAPGTIYFSFALLKFGDSPGSYWRIELEDGLKDPTLAWLVVFVVIACQLLHENLI